MGWYNRAQTLWGAMSISRKISEGSWAGQPQLQCSSSSRRDLLGGLTRSSSARGMATTTNAVRVFIVAGEPSGDAIGSRLMTSLRCVSAAPLEFAGVGGPLMEKQGLQSLFPMEDISVMGAVELIPHAFRLWARLQETVAAAVKFQPSVVVTVDAKGFSFRVLNGLREAYLRLGQSRPPTVHYVAPSFWAWKGGEERLKNLSKIVDHMLCILPFEVAVCQANGLAATFVGHPVLEDAHSTAANVEVNGDHNEQINGNGALFRQSHGIDSVARYAPGYLNGFDDLHLRMATDQALTVYTLLFTTEATVLSVLPGSRLQEVKRMLPIFEGALNLLAEDVPNLTVVIPTVQSQSVVRSIEAVVDRWSLPVVVLPGASETDKYNSFAASNAGLCTSGTAVVQLLMACVPCVVAYRAHLLTEWIIRSHTKLQFISLPNILLDAAVIPEALFADCTPRKLFAHLRPLIEDEGLQEMQRISGGKVLRMLAPPVRKNSHSSVRCIDSDMKGEPVKRPSVAAAMSILMLLEERAVRN